MMCSTCSKNFNQDAKFCSGCGAPFVEEPFVRRGRLYRSRQGKMIAGVCAGLAEHYGWDVAIVRLVVCLAVLLGCGTVCVAYLIAWIVMPKAPLMYTGSPMPPSPPMQATA